VSVQLSSVSPSGTQVLCCAVGACQTGLRHPVHQPIFRNLTSAVPRGLHASSTHARHDQTLQLVHHALAGLCETWSSPAGYSIPSVPDEIVRAEGTGV
jgi:hypothetical protein